MRTTLRFAFVLVLLMAAAFGGSLLYNWWQDDGGKTGAAERQDCQIGQAVVRVTPEECVRLQQQIATVPTPGSQPAGTSQGNEQAAQGPATSLTPTATARAVTASSTPTRDPTPVPPTNTPLPTATPIQDTPPGTQLSAGQTWIQNGMKVTISDVSWTQCYLFVSFRIQIQNATGGELVASFDSSDPGNFSAVAQNGQSFRYTDQYERRECPNSGGSWGFQSLGPGESQERYAGLSVSSDTDTSSITDVIVTISVGRVQNATWKLTVPR